MKQEQVCSTDVSRRQLIKFIDDYLDVACDRDFMAAFSQFCEAKDATVAAVGDFMWFAATVEYPNLRDAPCFRRFLGNIRELVQKGEALSTLDIERRVLDDKEVRMLFRAAAEEAKATKRSLLVFVYLPLLIVLFYFL